MTKNIKQTAALLLSSIALFWASCSSTITSPQSYINGVIEPEHLSPVYECTDVMLQAIRNQSVTPPPATRAFAMAHLSGFLAVNGIDQKYDSKHEVRAAPDNTNEEVAYLVAFTDSLSDALNASFVFDQKRMLARYAETEAKANGIRYGKYVASVIISDRINDGAEPNQANFYLDHYGKRSDLLAWSPTGPFYGAKHGPRFGTFGRGLFPGWGAQKPWVMDDKTRFRANPFLDPESEEFANQYEEIKALGGSESSTRTADETTIAFFWEDGPRGVTPPGHWQIIAMKITQKMDLSLLEQARLFSLLSMAQADAAITTWDSKYYYDIVRPETVIRTRASEFGQTGDKAWKSLIPTPSFPAYTSGHSTFSGASARILANFLGTDQVSFSSQSPDLVNWPEQLTGVTRSYTSLWEAAEEAGMSRIYGGIHWQEDNTEGLRVGRELADFVFNHAFRANK
ncbi:MAG: hypothetical protein CMO61_10740 [Verrucomicrobiales bacterium]|nr:hypothetical protein [Verrucomicrobiales bacterium]|tara:strand:+ start:1411 stop:2775 length:1365 start_codon:yes stop_codon:yes gene_type:complete